MLSLDHNPVGQYVMALPAVIEPCLPSPGEQPPTGPDWVHEIKHDGYRLMARRDALSVGIRLLTKNGHDSASRYPLIVEGFDDTLAGYRRAARHRRHATLDSVPARRLRRCLGRSRAFVSGRCLDVAEAGGALRANGSLESIFEFLLVKPPRESPATSCLRTPAKWGLKASCRSAWIRFTALGVHLTGLSSRTRRHLQSCGRLKRSGVSSLLWAIKSGARLKNMQPLIYN